MCNSGGPCLGVCKVSGVARGLGQDMCVCVSLGAHAWVCSHVQMCLWLGAWCLCVNFLGGPCMPSVHAYIMATWAGWVCSFTSTYTWQGRVRETKECAFCRNPGFDSQGSEIEGHLLFLNLVTWDKARAWKTPLPSFSPTLQVRHHAGLCGNPETMWPDSRKDEQCL